MKELEEMAKRTAAKKTNVKARKKTGNKTR